MSSAPALRQAPSDGDSSELHLVGALAHGSTDQRRALLVRVCRISPRQRKMKCRPNPLLGLEPAFPPMCLDNAVHDRQSYARPTRIECLSGGKTLKDTEDLLVKRLGNAHTIVTHHDLPSIVVFDCTNLN